MNTERKYNTLAEKLYDTNVLPNGALLNIAPADVIKAKLKKDSKFYRINSQ